MSKAVTHPALSNHGIASHSYNMAGILFLGLIN